MATYTWKGVNGDWSDSADWTGGPPAPPPNSSSAEVALGGTGAYTVTIGSGEGFTVASVSLSDVNAALAIDGSASLTVEGGAFTDDGTLALTGLLALTGTAALSVTGGFTNNGVLDLDIGGGDGGGSLTIGGTLANARTVQIGPNNATLGAATLVSLGGLTNASGASFQMYGSASHAETLHLGSAGFTSNSGAFGLTDTALSLSSAFTNNATGTVGLAGTAALSVTGGFTNNGVLDLDIGGGDGGGSLTIGGTLANARTVQIGPNNATLGAATLVSLGGLTNASGASFQMYGSASHAETLHLGSAGFTSNSGAFGLTDTALSLSSAFTNNATGTVGLAGTAALSVTGGFTNNGVLDLDIGGGDGGGSLTIGGTLANARTVQIGPNNATLGAATLVSLGGLTNASGASFQMYGSASHAETLHLGSAGFTSNSGAFGLTDTALSLSSAFTNNATGTVGLAGTAALSVTGGFTNNGVLDLDIGGGDGGGSLTIGGTLANARTVQIGPNNATLGAATLVSLGGLTNASGASFQMYGSASHAETLHLGSAGFTSNSGAFGLTDTALSLSSAFTNNATGTVGLAGTAALSVTGGFTNNGVLDLDIGGGDGGGSLTIGGTLANARTVQIGPNNATLGAATLVSLGGLTNASGASFQMYGSASHAETLNIAGSASNSGTLDINANTALHLTRSTGVFTQVAGETVVTGALSAPSIMVTGGTLEGTGTLTGALNQTGGTLVGGTLNSTTGTLNVSGAYNQSGTGVLQADINAGPSQQSSIIAVGGSPGTPGSSGSVNLAGGTLLINAESSLVLNTPYTLMTFGARHLYGQFGKVQTEGALGSHTGNGDNVNLGGGETLEVLYNEASGEVQVELVTTPSSTTYAWDVGSGTWNPSSGTDWKPPGSGAIPSPTSNVTIGTGAGGTVTLAQDQTIASLLLTSGYTLSGSTYSITTTGNASVAKGATLSVDDMNVGGSFTDNGSATFTGALTMNGTSQFTLSNGSLSGGINGTGAFEGAANTTNALKNVTIYKGTTFTASSGDTTSLSTALINEGAFVIDGTSGNSFVNLTTAVTLSGGGAVTLKSSSGGSAFLRGGGFTLTNTSDTIQGSGLIGDNAALSIVNKATIDANSKGQELNLNFGGGDITNIGTLEATGGGVLRLFNTITNTSANITASGGTVNVDNATVSGGTLNSAGGGLLQTVGTSDLNGVTISSGSTYTTAGATTTLSTSLVNDGTFLIDGSAANTPVYLGSNVTLSGGGTVTMKSGSGSAFLRGAGFTLTNANNTIQGSGSIGDEGVLAIDNEGTIDANSKGQELNLNFGGGTLTNTGTLEATGGGVLELFSTITNTGRTIAASGTGSMVIVDNATIIGGTLTGSMQTIGSSDLNGVTISSGSTYTTAGATTTLNTSLVNDGTFLIDGSTANTPVYLGSNVTLSGGGTVTMKSGSGAAFLRGSGLTLTNANNTIQGSGSIGDEGPLTIVNKATIDANVSGQELTLNFGGGALTNTGTLEATSAGHLDVLGAVGGAGQLKIGAGSELELGGATSENSTFLGTSSAKLRIDDATTPSYSGTINSFVSGDILELGNTIATTATPTFNSGPDTTTLTVDTSGGGHLLYTLAGNLSADTFSVTHVNSGADSDIAMATTPAMAQAISLLGDSIGSSLIDSSGLFGASGFADTSGSATYKLAVSPHANL